MSDKLQSVTGQDGVAKREQDERMLPFIIHYISTGSITDASNKVGISRMTGCRWLKRADAQELLIDQRNMLAHKVKVDAQSVLKELKSLAFSNVEDYIDENGQLKNISEMPNTGAIQELVVQDRVSPTGNKERHIKIKLVDKLASLNTLAKHLGLFNGDTSGRPITVNFKDVSSDQLRDIINGQDTLDITPHQEV